MALGILKQGLPRCFQAISATELSFEKVSGSSERHLPYFFFFDIHFFDSVSFKYRQVLVVFLLPKRSKAFLVPLFRWFSFPTLLAANSSKPNSIFLLWRYFFVSASGTSLFSVFVNTFISSTCLRWLIFTCDFENL